MRKNYLYKFCFCSCLFFHTVLGLQAECNITGTYTTSPQPPWCPFDTVLVTAVPTSGVGPYTYEWGDGLTTADREVIMDGTFHLYCTITDANGCTVEVLVHIKPNIYSTAMTYPLNGICQGDSGLLTVYGSGVLTYTYAWENGATTQAIYINQPGVYTVTLTVVETGCTREVSAFIPLPIMPSAIPEITGPATLCPGQNATLHVNGGPFGTYDWGPGGQTTPTLNINGPGTYTVTVSNPGQCTGTDVIDISPGPGLPPNLTGPANLCTGQNGTINITNSSSYTAFAWSTGQISASINVNQPGAYMVTVSAGSGCTATGNFTVNPSPGAPDPSTTVTSTICGQPNGAIDLDVSPAGTYSFLWSNGATSEDLSNLSAGNYTVTVTGAGGCSASATANVACVSCNLNGTYSTSIPPPFCPGDVVVITAEPIGGTGPYTYAWESGATTQSIQIVLGSDHYIDVVTITDATGCSYPVELHFKTAFLSVGFTWPLGGICQGDSALLQAFGSGVAPITYLWQNGSTADGMYITQAGTYSVTMTNTQTGCTHTESITVPLQVNPAPSPQIVGPALLCPGQSGTLSVNGGPFQTYAWSPGGQSSPTLAINGPGTYTVMVSNGGICSGTDVITISPEQEPPPQLTGAATICPGQNTTLGIATSGNYTTFLWSTGQNTPTITVNQPLSYTVTVTAAGGCTATGSITVSPDPASPNLSTSAMPATCGQANGAADLNVSPAGNYMFLWSNGANTEDLNNLASGNYTVTVTSAGGCSATTGVTVPGNNLAPNIDGTPSPNTACTGSNGSLDLSISPAGAYSFLWSNGATTEDLTNLSAGDYTVTVSAGGACTGTASFNIANNSNSPAVTPNATPATCGQSNGAVAISVTGGAAPLSYLWSNGATTEDLMNVAAGNYTLTVTGADGCAAVATAAVADNAVTPAATALASPNTACTGGNGSLDLSVLPAGAYTFLWSNGAVTEDLTNLSAGDYTVTVSAGGACTGTASFNIANNSNSPAVTPNATPATCGQSNGAVAISVTGGAAPLSYLWSNGATTEDLMNVAAGNYTLTVTGADGCLTNLSVTVADNNPVFSLAAQTTANTACSNPNGSLALTVLPAAAYTYLWSNGETTSGLQNLSAGTYTVTVTTGSNCTSSASYSVADSSGAPLITLGSTAASCGLANGSIDLALPSGAAGNTFAWSNGATTEDLAGLTAGAYSVTVTNSNGCASMQTISLLENNPDLTLLGATVPNTACQAANGSLDLAISPAGNYTFNWSNGATTEDLTGLSAGDYAVTVSGGGTCTATAAFTLADNLPLVTVSGNTTANTSCSVPDGSVDLTVLPAGAYTFSWSNGLHSEDLVQLTVATYLVTVTGSTGCTATASFPITSIQNIPAVATAAVPDTCGQSKGAVNLTVTGGTAPFNYLWSNGATTEDLTGLAANTYMVTVSDASGCTGTGNVVVSLLSPPQVAINGPTMACVGSTVALTASPGFASYEWSNGAAGDTISVVSAGNYGLTVTAANGCTATASVDFANFPALAIAVSGPAAICSGSEAMLQVTGNFDQILWSNGAGTPDVTVSQAGIYAVTVTDVNGCTASDHLDLSVLAPAQVFLEKISCFVQDTGLTQVLLSTQAGCDSFVVTHTVLAPALSAEVQVTSGMNGQMLSCSDSQDGTVTALPQGGSAPFVYQWNNGFSGTTLQHLGAGSYTVTITDLNGCRASAGLNLQAPPPLIATLSEQAVSCFSPGKITLEALAGGTAPYTLELMGQAFATGGFDPITIPELAPGVYTLVMTDANGCSSQESVTLTAPAGTLQSFTSSFQVAPGDTVQLQAPAGFPAQTMTWSPAARLSCSDCADPWLVATEEQVYTVVLHGFGNCRVMGVDTIALRSVDTKTPFYVPNVIHPGSSENGVFSVFAGEGLFNIRLLRIYTRWGELVTEIQNFPPNGPLGWAGDFRGSPVNPAVFVYYAELEFTDGTTKKIQGDVTVVR